MNGFLPFFSGGRGWLGRRDLEIIRMGNRIQGTLGGKLTGDGVLLRKTQKKKGEWGKRLPQEHTVLLKLVF